MGQPLCQLYDEHGQPLEGQGATRDDVMSKGLLHAASHVWIWRMNNDQAEVLLQKRGSDVRNYPGLYDISAAGHIDLGETPLQGALRETKEELNLDIAVSDLKLFAVYRAHLQPTAGRYDNEFQWLYSLEVTDHENFNLQEEEVDDVRWLPLEQFEAECSTDTYVPHSEAYYETVVHALHQAASM